MKTKEELYESCANRLDLIKTKLAEMNRYGHTREDVVLVSRYIICLRQDLREFLKDWVST